MPTPGFRDIGLPVTEARSSYDPRQKARAIKQREELSLLLGLKGLKHICAEPGAERKWQPSIQECLRS